MSANRAFRQLRLQRTANNVRNTVSLTTPTTLGSTYRLVLPTAVPSSGGQALITDTSGNLSWGSFAAVATQSSFSAANNVTTAANVTGLTVSTSPTVIPVYVSVSATSNLFAIFTLQIYYNTTLNSYVLDSTYVGDNTFVRFDTTTSGQIVYYSGNYAGFTSLTFTWLNPFTPVASVTTSLLLSNTITVGGAASFNGGMTASNWFPFRNKIHNGHMQIDQRGIGPYTASDQTLNLDRWRTFNSLTSNLPSVSQTTLGAANAPPLIANTGFVNALLWTSNATATTDTTVFNQINHVMEAQDIQNFQWGKSTGLSCTISFWVYATVSGTFALALRYNPSASSSSAVTYYVTTYTIPTASTWQYVSIVIPPLLNASAIAGGGSVAGLSLTWTMHGSSSNTNYGVTSNTNSWQAGNLSMVSNQTQLCATANSQWAMTGVQLEVGSLPTLFEWRPAQVELALCKRYLYCLGPYTTSYSETIHGVATTTAVWIGQVKPEVQMRILPTINFFGSSWVLDTYAVSSVSVSTGNISLIGSTSGFFNVLVNSPSTALVQYRPYQLTTNPASAATALIWFYADF